MWVILKVLSVNFIDKQISANIKSAQVLQVANGNQDQPSIYSICCGSCQKGGAMWPTGAIGLLHLTSNKQLHSTYHHHIHLYYFYFPLSGLG